MGLKDPKQTKKILNIFKNDSIWAQKGPEWAQMSLNELNKIFSSDAYRCKTWYILKFFKRRNKCQK